MSTSCLWKYDVFLSFRGADTRENFTSHLDAALSRKGIKTFIDNNMRAGEVITPSLLKAIEESKVAIIIFSEDYASSKWCLDELVKILECHEARGQIVIPVFYYVSPSDDAAGRTGVLAEAFAKHGEDFKDDPDKLQRWKNAITKLIHLVGFDSRVIRPESKLVEEIVKEVLRKLKRRSSCCLEGLVGINSQIQQIVALLSFGLSDVRILGIWGMGGVGKTTVAEAVFDELAYQFDGQCFLLNVREESERSGGLARLGEHLLSSILEEREIRICGRSIRSSLVKDSLHCKKVLIVLDDVSRSKQVEFLVGNRCWFGPGSRIIITSRDKHVLGQIVDDIYEVKSLFYDAALQLFSWNSFNQCHPPEDFMAVSDLVVKYAGGNPLALKVLGSFLFGRNKSDWESALQKLKKTPNIDIQNMLKISYDNLDEEEKDIFLYIACFFRGEDKNIIIQLLDSCGFSTEIGVCVLIDLSFVTVTRNKLEMHDLLQEMGKEIVRQECKEPGKRSRLWSCDDICRVLRKNTGTEAIEGIFLDTSMAGEMELSPKVFFRMSNLKLLKFYISNRGGLQDSKIYFHQGLKYLPTELRYLHWDGYPLRSLPESFNPENLVMLELRHNNLECLWNGTKNLEKLIALDLSHSKWLITIEIVGCALNLASIILEGCIRLPMVPSSISHLRRLSYINLKDCQNIKAFPSTSCLEFVETLVLTGCSRLERFPEVASSIKNLYLEGTAIEEVSSSIGCLSRLVRLYMTNCTKLKSLPTSICKLKSLRYFDLSGCRRLEKFPEILETMESLKELVLRGTSIKELPWSIDNMNGLLALCLEDCKSLARLPDSIGNMRALRKVFLCDCEELEELPNSIKNLRLLEHLWLTGCKGIDSVFTLPRLSGLSQLKCLLLRDCNLSRLPADLSSLSSLAELYLNDNNFETIPPSIKQLYHLKSLDISGCKRLLSLPELPLHLEVINAHDCISLETVSGFEQPRDFYLEYPKLHCRESFTYTNCFKLDQSARCNIVADAQQRIQRLANRLKDYNFKLTYFPSRFVNICYPGSDIPEWLRYQNLGSSITIQLPQDWNDSSFLGFALCVVVAFQDFCYGRFRVQCSCHFQDKYGDNKDFICEWGDRTGESEEPRIVQSEHVLLWYDHQARSADLRERHYNEGTFEFCLHLTSCDSSAKCCEVKKCGVVPLYAYDEEIKVGMKKKVNVEEANKIKKHRGAYEYGGSRCYNNETMV